MKYFKQEPTNLLVILYQSIWYNDWIKSGKNYLINNRLENKGISKMKDVLEEKCNFIDQSKINQKLYFFLRTSKYYFLPKSWKKMLNTCQHHRKCIQVQNTLKSLNKTTCKDIYWHILNLEN